MNERIKNRLIRLSLPSLVVAAVLYASFYFAWTQLSRNTALCVQTHELTNDVAGVNSCIWDSIHSLNTLGFIGLIIIPVTVLLALFSFSSQMRLSSIEKELNSLKEKLNV
jgi:hypothetical protein